MITLEGDNVTVCVIIDQICWSISSTINKTLYHEWLVRLALGINNVMYSHGYGGHEHRGPFDVVYFLIGRYMRQCHRLSQKVRHVH